MGSACYGETNPPLRGRFRGQQERKAGGEVWAEGKMPMHFAAGTGVVRRCLRAPTPHSGAPQQNPPPPQEWSARARPGPGSFPTHRGCAT